MHAIFVTLNVQTDKIAEFEEVSLGDGQGSTRDEPECFRFDIMRDPQIPGRYYLYEVYLNEASLEKHRETPHFKKWWATVEEWLETDLEKIDMETIFPSDAGWQTQKPHTVNW